MVRNKRIRLGALLLMATVAAATLAAPADARRRGRIHVYHHHHSTSSGSTAEPSHTNPWAKDPPQNESPISGTSLLLLVGAAIALGGGWLFLRGVISRAQSNPDSWSPQAPLSGQRVP